VLRSVGSVQRAAAAAAVSVAISSSVQNISVPSVSTFYNIKFYQPFKFQQHLSILIHNAGDHLSILIHNVASTSSTAVIIVLADIITEAM